MATNPFAKAHFEKIELNKKTIKKLKRAYSTTAKEVKNKLAHLPNYTTSDSLKKLYLEGLLKDLDKTISDLEKYVQTTILSATEASGQIAVKASEELMSQAGLEIKGAFSYVPKQEMANILSGKLYGSDWSFSKAIWGMEKKTKEDLEKIVARGLAENKPIYDIAKDLEKYVDPSARKPWDWSKVYPGTSKTVDYNAQRLARTMIQHAYQNSMVQAQRYNPFCKGIIWHSVGIHGRTCEVCEARDGQTFPVEDLPLDHPNGLCYFEPAIDKMDDVADRLADWVNGKADPELDTYVSKAFGFGTKTPEGKEAVNKVKSDTLEKASKVSSKPFDPKAWLDGVKVNFEDKMLKMEETAFKHLTDAQRRGIERYSGSGYEAMNDFLRRMGRGEITWSAEGSRLETSIKDAMAGLREVSLGEELYLRRGSDLGYLAGLLGGDFDENLLMLKNLVQENLDDYKLDAAAKQLSDMFKGTIGTFDGFTSTSSIWDRGFNGSVEYIFQAPKGTAGMSIMTISRFGTGEGEFLLNAGTRIKVKEVLPAWDNHKYARLRVFLEIIV